MNLSNIKTNKATSGFTIVELLIVIVVIGILAAITIVAYNGVQNRARTTEAQSSAKEVVNKAEVYAADTGNGVYPTAAQLKAATTGTAVLSTKVNPLINGTTPAAAPASGTPTAISYATCGTSPNFTGAKVGYWDYAAGAPVYLNAGSATGATGPTC